MRKKKVSDNRFIIILSAVGLVLLIGAVVVISTSSDDPAGDAVKDVISKSKEKVKEGVEKIDPEDCKATICELDNKEIYCPDDFETCSERYDFCRTLWCEDKEPEKKTVNAPESDIYVSTESGCTEKYNDCVDDEGEDIICHGDFDDCVNAFTECRCGTQDDTSSDSEGNTLDFNEDSADMEAKNAACDTGIFLCEKMTESMTGEYVKSTVECKGNYAQCAQIYGDCRCGNTTLTWYDEEDVDWCDWNGMQVRCDMICENEKLCPKAKNTCDKGNGIMVICDGSMPYCNTKYDHRCLCGINDHAVKEE